jgi:hypothetical protein
LGLPAPAIIDIEFATGHTDRVLENLNHAFPKGAFFPWTCRGLSGAGSLRSTWSAIQHSCPSKNAPGLDLGRSCGGAESFLPLLPSCSEPPQLAGAPPSPPDTLQQPFGPDRAPQLGHIMHRLHFGSQVKSRWKALLRSFRQSLPFRARSSKRGVIDYSYGS